MKEQAAASVQAEELLPVGYNRKERFAHVQQLVASITVVHPHVLPVFSLLRLQEVVAVAHVPILITADLPAVARVLIQLRQAAVAVAVDRSVAEAAAVAAVQVAAVAAVVQVDADNERDNIIIV